MQDNCTNTLLVTGTYQISACFAGGLCNKICELTRRWNCKYAVPVPIIHILFSEILKKIFGKYLTFFCLGTQIFLIKVTHIVTVPKRLTWFNLQRRQKRRRRQGQGACCPSKTTWTSLWRNSGHFFLLRG
jgi:hypothetical protein